MQVISDKSSASSGNKISVVMPVHNGGEHLQPAVTSILDQTEKNLELILIDDHSTDHAIDSLDKNDSRLRIVSNFGLGIVAALNTGLEHARHPFIARMDADDIAQPTRLTAQLDYLLSRADIQICGTQVELFCENSELGGGYKIYQDWINTLNEPDMIATNMFIESPIPHPSAMMHRKHWQQLQGYQDCDWPEDYDLWLRAHLEGFRFGKPQGQLLRWRDHDDRLSRVSNRYDKKAFFRAKAFYLTKKHPERQYLIWGSGPTGALLHDEIIKHAGVINGFIDIAPKRIGNTKRNKPISSAFETKKTDDLILIAVSARGAREQIRQYLNQRGFIEAENYICVA